MLSHRLIVRFSKFRCFSCCPLSLHTLCTLAGAAATALVVAVFVGFLLLPVSMTVVGTAQKLLKADDDNVCPCAIMLLQPLPRCAA